MRIELTEQQLNNLQVFLDRVELKGREAIAYVDLLAALEQGVNSMQKNKDQK